MIFCWRSPLSWLAPLSADSYGLAGVFMLINSWRLCRAKEPVERIGYAVLWAVMVLLMNAHDITRPLPA
jgi:hypothetical protein